LCIFKCLVKNKFITNSSTVESFAKVREKQKLAKTSKMVTLGKEINFSKIVQLFKLRLSQRHLIKFIFV